MVGFLPDDLENYISAHSESGGDVEKALRKFKRMCDFFLSGEIPHISRFLLTLSDHIDH